MRGPAGRGTLRTEGVMSSCRVAQETLTMQGTLFSSGLLTSAIGPFSGQRRDAASYRQRQDLRPAVD